MNGGCRPCELAPYKHHQYNIPSSFRHSIKQLVAHLVAKTIPLKLASNIHSTIYSPHLFIHYAFQITLPLESSFAFSYHKQMSASILVAEATWQEIQSKCSVTDDHLWTLLFIFGKNFERATRIVDQRGVKKISGQPSGRYIFQVMGESRRKEEYLCFPENFCSCYAFFYDVVNRGEQLCCKHQLAARLAASLGAYLEVKVSDEELAMLLSKL